MALETGVDIKLDVTGEKALKTAFESVRLQVRALNSDTSTLNGVLKVFEGTEKSMIKEFSNSSKALRDVRKETVNLSKEHELLAKYTGLTRKEIKMLVSSQDDLIRRAKELNINGAARTNYLNSQTKKIAEQIQLNKQLENSIQSLIKTESKSSVSNVRKSPQGVGDQMVAQYRANILARERISKASADNDSALLKKRMSEEAFAGNNLVQLFRKNQESKRKISEQLADSQVQAFKRSQIAAQRYADGELKNIERQLKQVQVQAELMAKGLSKTTANGVFRLQTNGASQAQIQSFIDMRKQIEALNRPTRNLGSSFGSLGAIIRNIIPTVGALGLASVLTQVAVVSIQTADALNLLKNRTKLVLDEGQDLNTVFKGLVETSVENRASILDTVTLYNRLVPALKSAGVSTKSAETVVDSFQKTLLISGASVKETSAAILQFSQAMASGKLNGDEFRSISEAAPEFLRAFSRATGVAAGSLKELASEGALTTEVISAAMVLINEELENMAKGIDLTFSQSAKILETRLAVMVNTLDETTGATKFLADETYKTSESVKEFTKWLEQNDRNIKTMMTGIKDLYENVSFLTNGFRDLVFTGVDAFLSRIIPMLDRVKAAKEEWSVSAGNGQRDEWKGSAGNGQRKESLKDLTQEQRIIDEFKKKYGEASGAAAGYNKELLKLQNRLDKKANSDEGYFQIEKKRLEQEKEVFKLDIERIKTSDLSAKQKEEQIAKDESAIEAIDKLIGVKRKLADEEIKSDALKAARKAANKKDPTADELDRINKFIYAQKELIVELENEANSRTKQSLKLTEGHKLQNAYLYALEKSGKTLSADAKSKIESALALEKESIALKKVIQDKEDYAKAQAEAGVKMNEVLEASDDLVKKYKEETHELKEQTLRVGKQSKELLALELAKLDLIITNKKQRISEIDLADSSEQIVEAYRKEIQEIEDLKDAKNGLFKAERKDEFRKEFNRIAEDIGKALGDAMIKGGKEGTQELGKYIKTYFQQLVIRLTLEPAIKKVGDQLYDLLNNGKMSDISSFTSAIGTLTAGSVGGSTGLIANQGLKYLSGNAGEIAKFGDALFSSTIDSISNLGGVLSNNAASIANFAGEIAPYAGAIALALQGQYKQAAGSAAGTYAGTKIGSNFGPYGAAIGAAIGAIFGSKIGGANKVSAQNLSPEFGQEVRNTISEQYLDLVKKLGGQASDIIFSASGNTGRQGQNSNFNLNATSRTSGKNLFNSAWTAEGQADGLFQLGEISLNEASMTDQTTRALVAALQSTNFAKNINEVLGSVSPFSASLKELNQVLADAEFLKNVNTEFAKLSGAMKTLAGASLNTIRLFTEMAGGLENLSNLESAYINAIYTEEEKLALQTDNLTKEFAKLGGVIPKNAAEYKNLVDSMDLSTVKGQQMYLTLLSLAPAFASIQKEVESLVTTITSNLNTAIDKQITLSKEAASSARDVAKQYLNVSESLRKTGKEVFRSALGKDDPEIAQKSFESVLKKALTGDIESLKELESQGKTYAEILSENAGSREELLLQTAVLRNQLDQAGAVAEVLGIGADYQAMLFDVQTASLEVLKEQIESGNITQDILNSHSVLLTNIAQQIAQSGNLVVGATKDSAGITAGALFDSSGRVIAGLNADTVLQIQAAQNAQNSLGLNFANSLNGQTGVLSGLSQQQIQDLQTLDDTASKTTALTDIVARATEGSENLLNAVLNRLSAQDNGSLNIVQTIQKGNLEITNYLNELVSYYRKEAADQAAEAKRVKDLAAAQASLKTTFEQQNKAVGEVQYSINRIKPNAANFGVNVQNSSGAFNSASFKIDETGRFSSDYSQTGYYVGNEAGVAGWNKWYLENIYNQTFGRANELENLASQVEAQRELIRSLGGIPAFAKGGYHDGGLALVGEKGPELVNFNSGGMIYDAQKTRDMISGANQNIEVMQGLNRVADRIDNLDTNLQAGMYSIAKSMVKQNNLLERWDAGDALTVRVEQDPDESLNVMVV